VTTQPPEVSRFTRYVVCNLPILLVVGVMVGAVVLVLEDRWRRGAFVFGIATLIAAGLRFSLPEWRVGILAVRSKRADCISLAAVGTMIVWLAYTIDPLGTG
jgi:hypothetical protein